MSASKVNRENFITVQGWMLTDLKLKGNELLIYACIYGFSQYEGQVFNGSLQYLADWTNSTKQGVTKCLKSLVAKGYIEKNEKFINNVKFCEYYATKLNEVLNKVVYPMQQSLIGDMQQSLPNNIDIDNLENKLGDNKANYQLIVDMYNSICISLPRVIALSDNRKKAIKARLNKYTVEDFKTVFKKAEASSFLKGSNNTSWSATFDWLIKDSNMVKVLEGNYDNEKKAAAAPRSNYNLDHLKAQNKTVNSEVGYF